MYRINKKCFVYFSGAAVWETKARMIRYVFTICTCSSPSSVTAGIYADLNIACIYTVPTWRNSLPISFKEVVSLYWGQGYNYTPFLLLPWRPGNEHYPFSFCGLSLQGSVCIGGGRGDLLVKERLEQWDGSSMILFTRSLYPSLESGLKSTDKVRSFTFAELN